MRQEFGVGLDIVQGAQQFAVVLACATVDEGFAGTRATIVWRVEVVCLVNIEVCVAVCILLLLVFKMLREGGITQRLQHRRDWCFSLAHESALWT